MSHTPGPWKINQQSLIAAPIIETSKRRIAKALYHMGSEDREVYPNAQLISAAPDLLESLEELLKWFSFSKIKSDVSYAFIDADSVNTALKRAREVVAKVKGGK